MIKGSVVVRCFSGYQHHRVGVDIRVYVGLCYVCVCVCVCVWHVCVCGMYVCLLSFLG